MTPVEFLARIAAIIPPPRHPLLRYVGVFGPNSSWRKLCVPQGVRTGLADQSTAPDASEQANASAGEESAEGTSSNGDGRKASALTQQNTGKSADEQLGSSGAIATSTRVSPAALNRSRIDWATLLRRTYEYALAHWASSCPSPHTSEGDSNPTPSPAARRGAYGPGRSGTQQFGCRVA